MKCVLDERKVENVQNAYGLGCNLPVPDSCPDALWHAASTEAINRC